MAAVEILESPAVEELVRAPHLRLVAELSSPRSLQHGPSLAQRRAARARMMQRRRRTLAGLVLVAALSVLALPGHVLGATTGAGLSTDLAGSSVLASGMDYVVQTGDTVSSISRSINPVDPSLARSLLVRELGSSVVVPGEHVLIP
ncbi:MAG TPA: hypothetical protein VII67_07280 [Acidimicrobiales bacterium]